MNTGRKDIAAIIIFVALIVAFIFLINGITAKGGKQEINVVRDAVKNAALTCYSVEGAYPADLEYLREHYNLAYNEDRYIIYYEAFASNLMPDIQVAERGSSAL